VEASFTSKLVATIDTSKPVWDKYLLKNVGLKAPGYHIAKDRRLNRCLTVYESLEKRMKHLLQSETGKMIVETFDEIYPQYAERVSNIKKLDFALWKIR
jgi:hypothetical protein